MPEVSSCSLSNRDDLTSIDPDAAPPVSAASAPPGSPDANSCYACADGPAQPEASAVFGLVSSHDGAGTASLFHAGTGQFSLDLGQAEFESSQDGAGLGLTALRVGVEGPVAVEVTALSA